MTWQIGFPPRLAVHHLAQLPAGTFSCCLRPQEPSNFRVLTQVLQMMEVLPSDGSTQDSPSCCSFITKISTHDRNLRSVRMTVDCPIKIGCDSRPSHLEITPRYRTACEPGNMNRRQRSASWRTGDSPSSRSWQRLPLQSRRILLVALAVSQATARRIICTNAQSRPYLQASPDQNRERRQVCVVATAHDCGDSRQATSLCRLHYARSRTHDMTALAPSPTAL